MFVYLKEYLLQTTLKFYLYTFLHDINFTFLSYLYGVVFILRVVKPVSAS